MEPISQNKDNNFSSWEALIENYLNDEKKNHRATSIRDLEFRQYRFLVCFKQNQFQEIAKLYFIDFLLT